MRKEIKLRRLAKEIPSRLWHALYTDARHVHEHDEGHELAHDEEDLESCTYWDIGVACLAVF